MTSPVRIGIDVGGTFTDFVLHTADGSVRALKVLSSPPDFSEAVMAGITELLGRSALAPEAVAELLHGTTVATNAILENRGARAVLVTTTGFRDVLELARMRHPSLYDVSWRKPPPLVPRRRRFELDLRIAADGSVIERPTHGAIEELLERIEEADAEAIAVCLINSYCAPQVERELAALLEERSGCGYVCCSVDILPEMKEYERTSTAVVNAFVGPVVDRYLHQLTGRLEGAGVRAPLMVMQSSGGLLDVAIGRRQPVRLIESGPAAGVTAAAKLARQLSMRKAVSFDMGGTTAKTALIEGGRAFEAREYEVGGGMSSRQGFAQGAGYAIRVPSVDVAEIGAGGGSICWIDDGACPRVGPASAGARPGPACYANGGTDPTLTDALVVLGYLSPLALAGGSQPIEAGLAREAFERSITNKLRVSLSEAAYGFYQIAAAAMSNAVKAVTSQRGRDPREFTLIAFGGAGPAYGAEIARQIGMPRVLVPAMPGLFSAVGLLAADVHYDSVRSLQDRVDGGGVLGRRFEEMERELARELAEVGAAGWDFARSADARYAGQSYELQVPVPHTTEDEQTVAAIREAFEVEHLSTYGHRDAAQRVEIVNLRVRATRRSLAAKSSAPERDERNEHAGPVTRLAHFGPVHGPLLTPVVGRGELSEQPRPGPFIIEDMDATTVVPPGTSASLDALGDVVIALAG